LAALVYGLGEAASVGWSSTQVIVSLITGGVLLALFVVVQARVSNPLLPLRILAHRSRAGSFLTITLISITIYGTFLFLTYLLQTVDHFSPLKTGVAFLPFMAANGLAATQVASRLMPHLRTKLLIIPGLFIAAVGVAILTQLTPHTSYVGHVLPAEILLGFGVGMAMVPCLSTATTDVNPLDAGVTSAMATTSQQIGSSIGVALLNTIAGTATAAYLVSHHGSPNLAALATVHGFAVASVWALGSLLVAVVVASALINADPGRDLKAADLAKAEASSEAALATSD
jgi:hypothetical protein